MSESSLKAEATSNIIAEVVKPVSVAVLGSAAFIVTADVRVVNPLLHIIANDYRAEVGATGIIVTAYTIPYGLFQLVYGPLGDRLGKLKIMAWAMALFAIGTAACGLAPDLFTLSLLRFLTGVAAAAMIPMSLAYIGDTFPYDQRQAAIGKFLTAVALGQILSASLGGIVGDFLNWRLIFGFYGLISLVVFGILFRASRRSPAKVNPDIQRGWAAYKPYGRLLAKPGPRTLIIAVFIEGLFFFGGFTFLGAFLRDKYGLAYIAIGFMLTGFGLGNLVYGRSVRWLLARLGGEDGLIFWGGALTFACYLAIALLEIWVLFIPLNIILGVSYYMLHSTLQTRATEMSPGMRGTAVSLFAFSLFLGQGIGTAALGLIVDGPGYVPAFVIAGVGMLLLGTWIVYQTRRIVKKGLVS